MDSKDKLWNANYWKVMAANFSMWFAFYLLTPLLPLYLSDNFNASKDLIGLVLSGYTLTALLIRPFSGYVVDSFPRKRVLLVAFFFYFLFFGTYLLASTLLLFAIVRTLHGVPFGATTVANSTIVIDVLPSSRRNEGISLLRQYTFCHFLQKENQPALNFHKILRLPSKSLSFPFSINIIS